jgi:replicative DNA helicase
MVVKNRNGSLGNVGMKFIEDKTKYVDANDNNTPF